MLALRRPAWGSVRRNVEGIRRVGPSSRRPGAFLSRAVPGGDQPGSALSQDGWLDDVESPDGSLIYSAEDPQAAGGTWDAAASDDADLLLSMSDAAALSSGDAEEENPYTSADAQAR